MVNHEKETKKLLQKITFFYIYQGAYIPKIVSWAKKKNKGKTHVNSEILKTTCEKYQNFIQSCSPHVYQNMLEIMQAIIENDVGPEYLNEYKKVAQEFRSELDIRETIDGDERMRLALANVIEYIGEHGCFPSWKEINKLEQWWYHYAINLPEGVKTHKEAWKRNNNFSLQDANIIADGIAEAGIENEDEDDEMKSLYLILQEMMAWCNIPTTDFSKTKISTKYLRKICQLVYLRYLEDTDAYEKFSKAFDDDAFIKEGVSEEDVEIAREARLDAINFIMDRSIYLTAIYKFMLMYDEARDIANDALDKISELKAELETEKNRNVRKEIREEKKQKAEENSNAAKEARKQVDKLEADNEKSQLRIKELEAENKFLKDILRHEDDNETEGVDEPLEETINYPKGTILFGGHPNWQRKFFALHPNIKVMSGTDAGFPENVLSSRTYLVLLNSRHMSHKVFFKIRALQKRMKFKLEYI